MSALVPVLLTHRARSIPGIIKANARALYHTKAGGISGSLLLDQSPLNSGTRRTGEEGRCYLYDRTDDYSNLNSTVSIAGDFSFCFNVNFTSLASSQYLFSKSGSPQHRCFISVNGVQIALIINNDVNYIDLDSRFQVGEDCNVCIVRESNTITFYKDGVAQADTEFNSDTFEFNRLSDASNTLGAKLFDIRVYNKALTQSEVNFVKSFGQTGTDPDLPLHWWKCDEQSGTIGYDSVGGNHLTHTNITAGTFHATQDIWSFQNQVGAGNYLYGNNVSSVATITNTSNLLLGVADFEISFGFFYNQAGVICEKGGTANTSYIFAVNEPAWVGGTSNKLVFWTNGGSGNLYSVTDVTDGNYYQVKVTRVSNDFYLYINGVLEDTASAASFNQTDTSNITLLRSNGNARHFGGGIRNFKIIKNNETIGDLLCDEGFGNVCIDSSGYNHNAVLSNTSWLRIPRDKSDPTNDVLGNPLTNTGRRPNDAALHSSNCLTADGTLYIAAAHLAGTETVVSSGGTSTPSISAGRINFTAGTCWDLLLSDGTHYPLSEGGGIGIHDDSGSGNHGILTNAVLANAWGGSQDSYNKNLSDGFVYAYQPAKQVFTGAQAANIKEIRFKFRSADSALVIFNDGSYTPWLLVIEDGSTSTLIFSDVGSPVILIDGSSQWGTTRDDLHNVLCDGDIHQITISDIKFVGDWSNGIHINKFNTLYWDTSTYLWDLQAFDSDGNEIVPVAPDVRLPAVTSSLGPYSMPLTDLPSDPYHNRAETLIDLDPDSTPEMGASQLGITVPASHAFGDVFAASTQIFSRQRTLTEDRFVVMPEAQTGSALTNIQKYTQP